MGHAVAPFRTVQSRVDCFADAVERRRQDEGGDDHRIEPGNTAETVLLESTFPPLAHPGDDETRQYEEHENGGSPAIELPEQTSADPPCGVMRHKYRKRRAEAQRVEIERKRVGHRKGETTRPIAALSGVRRGSAAVRRDPLPCRLRSGRHNRSFADHGPCPAGRDGATPPHRSGPSGKSEHARRTGQSRLWEGHPLRAAAVCGNTRSAECRRRGSRWSSPCHAPTARCAYRRTPSCCRAG